MGGGFLAGFPRGDELRSTFELGKNVRNDLQKREREEDEGGILREKARERERERASRKEEVEE